MLISSMQTLLVPSFATKIAVGSEISLLDPYVLPVISATVSSGPTSSWKSPSRGLDDSAKVCTKGMPLSQLLASTTLVLVAELAPPPQTVEGKRDIERWRGMSFQGIAATGVVRTVGHAETLGRRAAI